MSAIILAGGESKRMGQDKAWLEWDGTPLIHLLLEKVRSLGVTETFVSGRRGEDYSALKCPVLFDREPGFGPLAGIERGLAAASCPLLLVLAVDLPCMTTLFLRKLLARCDRSTGVVPRLKGEWEPLAAIYPKRCHAFAFEALAKGRRAARDFVDACVREHAVRTFSVPAPDAACLANWNAPADIDRRKPA